MIFLPYESLTFKTNLDKEEVLNRITEVTDKRKTFRFFSAHEKSTQKAYEGSIIKNKFSINRIINYRNSFLPIISGVVNTELNQTIVKVQMKPHILVVAFMSAWIGMLGIGLISMYFQSESDNQLDWTIVIMILFGYLLVIGGFKFESVPSKKYLSELLEAKIE